MNPEVPPINDAWEAAFNAGEIDELMALYTEDVITMPPGMPRVEGLEGYRAAIEGLFETTDAFEEMTLIEQHASDDLIVELYEYYQELEPLDGSETIVDNGTLVLMREEVDGEWLIAMQIWNSDGGTSEE